MGKFWKQFRKRKMLKTLKNNNIRHYYQKKEYLQAFYLLAMVDYLSRINNVPLCKDYDDIPTDPDGRTLFEEGIGFTDTCSYNSRTKRDEGGDPVSWLVRELDGTTPTNYLSYNYIYTNNGGITVLYDVDREIMYYGDSTN